MKKRKFKIKKHNKKKIIIIITSVFVFFISLFLFLLYGPYSGFRNWLITTAMTTLNHQYLATWFYSDETIRKVLEANNLIEPEGNTDTSLITLEDEVVEYKDEYDEQILKRNKGDIYKIIEIEGDGYSGYLAAVYDPSKIKLVTSKYLGTKGEYLVDMAKENNAVLAINGGGFLDTNGQGDGGTVSGIVIKDGEIINNGGRGGDGGLIGFTNDNKLFLGRVSASEAINLGVRDAIEFGPFLIINGESSFINGNGGYGKHPRSVIGQRKDGIVLMLVIDGRRIGCVGADMDDLVEIMLRYGAYNAANLDGGNSSVMVVNNEIINHPINWDNLEKTRPIPNGFIVVK